MWLINQSWLSIELVIYIKWPRRIYLLFIVVHIWMRQRQASIHFVRQSKIFICFSVHLFYFVVLVFNNFSIYFLSILYFLHPCTACWLFFTDVIFHLWFPWVDLIVFFASLILLLFHSLNCESRVDFIVLLLIYFFFRFHL